MKNMIIALTIVFIFIFRKGIASGRRVEAHIIGKRYSFSDFGQRSKTINYDPD